MPFRDGEVTVEVPATSANLGPGYDSLGVSLGHYDTLTASIADDITVTVEGEGEGRLPVGDRHLVVRSMLAAFARAGVEAPGVRLHC
ncbi:MAG: homoserine kinase, partial [Marmoricola sp.]